MKWLRLLVRLLLGAAVLVALAMLVLLWPLRGRVVEALRPLLESEIAAAVHAPVSIGALRVSFVPPQVESDDVRIGADGALARARGVVGRLLVRTSLRQLRPVADVSISGTTVDVPAWVALAKSRPKTPSTPLLPFRLRVTLHELSVRLASADEPLDLRAVEGEGELTSTGRLGFSLTSRDVALTHGQRALQLSQVTASGGETVTGWRLRGLEAVGDGVELRSEAAVADRLPIHGRVALPRLAFASPVFERFGGEAEVDVALIGALEALAAAGTVRVTDFSAEGRRIGDVSATAEWTLHKLTVSKAQVAGFGGQAQASGTLALDAPFAYDATLQWSGLDARQLAPLGEHAIKPFSASGRADAAGTLVPMAVHGEGSGSFSASQGEPLQWRGRADYRNGAGGGEVDATQGTRNTLRTHLDVSPARALNGTLAATVADPTALGAFLPIESLPQLSGSLTASALVAGTTDDPRLDGELGGRDIALLGVSVDKLAGSFALDRTVFRTEGITADLGQGSLALVGAVAISPNADNDWQLRASDVAGDAVVAVVYSLSGSVLPIGRGTLILQVSGHGPWTRAQIGGSAMMRDFWLGREWIQRATLAGSVTWPRWQLDGELRNRADQTIELRASGTGAVDASIDARSSGWQLTSLQRGELSETGGILTLDASFTGPLRALNGRATVQANSLVLSGRPIGDVAIAAEAQRGRWQLTSTLLEGTVEVRGSVGPEAGWPFTLDGDWREARFGRLLVPNADVWIVSTGSFHVGGRLAALEQVEATARIDALRIINGPYELAAPRPAQFQCKRGVCTLDALELRGAETELRASGTIATGGAVQLRLTGQGDLRLLELAGGAVESARGRFNVDADIRRGGGGWDIAGEMTVDQAALDVGAPMAITRANGRLVLTGTTVRIEKLGGRMGTGTFDVVGTLDLAHGPDVSWTLIDVGANLAPSLEVELSGSGTLSGSWQRMLLAGRIDVARMLYDRDIELIDFLPTLNRALAEAPRPPSAHRIELDLRVVAPGELFVENNVARLEARADLRITGTAGNPQLSGRIEILDGQVTFRDRVFEIQGGTADFRPDLGLAAAINISAESTIDTPDATYIVDVYVTGTTREPRVALSSDDPSLTQTDLGTLIALGKTTSQLRQSGGGGGFSIGTQQSTRQLLPIDRISFESTYSRTSGTFEPQLKLGKDLTDSLSVAVGQTFGVSSRTLAEADYRLTPRIFIPVSWESQTSTQEGAFGAGVKVRYEFWHLTPFTLLGGALR